MVFDDDFSTVPFTREVTIPPNWTDLLQRSSQIYTPEIIVLEDTWFTPDLEEDTSETPRHKPVAVPNAKNKNKMIASSPCEPYSK